MVGLLAVRRFLFRVQTTSRRRGAMMTRQPYTSLKSEQRTSNLHIFGVRCFFSSWKTNKIVSALSSDFFRCLVTKTTSYEFVGARDTYICLSFNDGEEEDRQVILCVCLSHYSERDQEPAFSWCCDAKRTSFIVLSMQSHRCAVLRMNLLLCACFL